MNGGFTLSATEFEVLWELLALPERPVVLDVPTRGGTDQERHHVVAQATESLRAKRLLDVRGPDADLEALCALLARPGWAVDAWLRLDRPVRAQAAASGERATLAVVDGERVTLVPSSRYRVIDGLVGMIGINPGPGASVSVPADDLDAAAAASRGDTRRLIDELRRRGARYDDADLLARMCPEHTHTVQFSVAVHHRTAGRSRGRRVIGLHATAAGWYLQVRRCGYVTVTPASAAKVSEQLNDLVGETTDLVTR